MAPREIHQHHTTQHTTPHHRNTTAHGNVCVHVHMFAGQAGTSFVPTPACLMSHVSCLLCRTVSSRVWHALLLCSTMQSLRTRTLPLLTRTVTATSTPARITSTATATRTFASDSHGHGGHGHESHGQWGSTCTYDMTHADTRAHARRSIQHT